MRPITYKSVQQFPQAWKKKMMAQASQKCKIMYKYTFLEFFTWIFLET